MLLTKVYLVSKTKRRSIYGAGFYYMEKSTVNILQKISCIWNNIRLSEIFFILWMKHSFKAVVLTLRHPILKTIFEGNSGTSVVRTKLLIFKLLFTETMSGNILKLLNKIIINSIK